MTTLSSIPGIGQSSLDLLEAAGFINVEGLAKAEVDELTKEIERANQILQIAENTPDRSNVEGWIYSARELSALADNDAVDVAMPVNRESGDLEARSEDCDPSDRPVDLNPQKIITENSESRLEFDISRIKSTDSLAGLPRTNSPSIARDGERVALIRAPRPETNQGRNPMSRNYIRGVLHSHPVSLFVGAIFTLLLVPALPAGIISAILLLLSRELPKYFSWVPEWLLVFPLALPVLGIAYLIWGMHGNCRICGQKLFVPLACMKNTKAHHIRGLGHIIPVCLHILLFKWFRCTYCGTPIRLKK